MKQQVIFIHGGDSFSRQEDFLQYLKETPVRNLPGSEVGKHFTHTLREDLGENFEVFMPSMPNKQNADFLEWSVWFERHFTYLSREVVLVGWSLGGMFIAKYLAEKNPPFKIRKVFLLAAPCGTVESEDGNDCGNFQFGSPVLEKLANSGLDIEIWHSKDDFVVPFSHALKFIEVLPLAKNRFFEDKNHFLVSELPELIEKIKGA